MGLGRDEDAALGALPRVSHDIATSAAACLLSLSSGLEREYSILLTFPLVACIFGACVKLKHTSRRGAGDVVSYAAKASSYTIEL